MSQCSKILINLLLERDRELLSKTKQRILILETKLAQLDHVTKVQTQLKETLDKFEKDIILRRKFARDK